MPQPNAAIPMAKPAAQTLPTRNSMRFTPLIKYYKQTGFFQNPVKKA
jgi:hypothetical protein